MEHMSSGTVLLVTGMISSSPNSWLQVDRSGATSWLKREVMVTVWLFVMNGRRLIAYHCSACCVSQVPSMDLMLAVPIIPTLFHKPSSLSAYALNIRKNPEAGAEVARTSTSDFFYAINVGGVDMGWIQVGALIDGFVSILCSLTTITNCRSMIGVVAGYCSTCFNTVSCQRSQKCVGV